MVLKKLSKITTTILYTLLPQHLLSRVVGFLANRRLGFLKNAVIAWFIRHYGVDMQLAQQSDYRRYPTFNAFFTRLLKPEYYAVTEDAQAVISPVEGRISEIGILQQQRLLQAKGHEYQLADLLAREEALVQQFSDGAFLTAYLAPYNYHRIHMPVNGQLQQLIYVPGRLFPVKPKAVDSINGLFARNERVICVFSTALGKVVVIAIGAFLVGSMTIRPVGRVFPLKPRGVTKWDYEHASITLKQGEELGYFSLGSSVMVLFPKNTIQWLPTLHAQSPLQLGQSIAVGTQ